MVGKITDRHKQFIEHASLASLVFLRPGNVCRDQDGERKVKGLWNSEI